jgi:chromosome segregation ATPase
MDILQNTKAHLNSANGNVQAARNEYERRKSGLKSAINRAEDNVRHATEEVNRQAAVVQQREQELSTLQNELTKLKEENNVKEIEVKQQQEYISKLKKTRKRNQHGS